MSQYKTLLSPIMIGDNIIKNRMMYPNASPHFLQGPENYPAENYIAFMAGLAKNGAAIITLSGRNGPSGGPVEDDMSHMQRFNINDAQAENYISSMTEQVHFYGSKILVHVDVDLPEGYSLNGGPEMGPPGFPPRETKMLETDMIPQVTQQFADSLKYFVMCGFDGLAIRLDRALCPSPNPRQDAYGGSAVNRTRLYLECLKKAKEVYGPNFIIEAVIAGEQPKGYTGGQTGYTLEDAVEFALAAEGIVDILQIRERDMAISHPTGFTFQKGEHKVIAYCEAIKKAGCRILLEPIGGFQDPDEIEGYLAAGKCDMIGMARAFMCDFEFGKKIAEGRAEDIRPCLWCNKCHGTILPKPDPWVSVCSVNPMLGLQSASYRLLDKPEALRKVAVIGGGPAGMRTALEAAELGHRVTLFEKSDYLGGQLKHSDSFSFKWPIREYKAWLIRQLEKTGVEIRMQCVPEPEQLVQEGFEAVIAATGAQAQLPASIEGLRDETGKALYPTCVDVFGKESELGHHVAVVGGSETGIETAMYLAENGHEVTVLTRQAAIGHDCSRLHYITMTHVKDEMKPGDRDYFGAAWEKFDNLRGITGVTTKSVQDQTVTYVDADGKTHTLEADSVVICGGMKPMAAEAMKYAIPGLKFFAVGDCNGAGNLQRLNREAFSRARQI